jgi:hypothetical protein
VVKEEIIDFFKSFKKKREMTEVTIPIFDGEDYGSWKKRILMYLKMKKCDVVISRTKKEDDGEDWVEKDLKAINYIYSAITNRQLEFVSDQETAYEIIKKLDELYSKESTALQIVCRNKLERLKLNDYDDTAIFFGDFEKAVNDLKTAGAKITEKEKMNYMLRTLPESLSYIGDLVDVLKEEDQTTEYVKSKIKNFKDTEREKADPKSNAFVTIKKSSVAGASKKEQRCHGCGKLGHYVRDCGVRRGSWTRGGASGVPWRGAQHEFRRGYGSGSYGRQSGYCDENNYRVGQYRGDRGNQRVGQYQGDRGNQRGKYTMSNFHTEVKSVMTIDGSGKSDNMK